MNDIIKGEKYELKKLITPALFSMLCTGGANASLVDMCRCNRYRKPRYS